MCRSATLLRRKPVVNKINAFTKKNLHWLRRGRRHVVAYERLAAQGLSLEMVKKARGDLSESDLYQLSGDMMNAFNLVPSLLAQLLTFDSLVPASSQ